MQTEVPLENYEKGTAPLPTSYRRWHLYGAGMENVGGKRGKPETVDLPEIGDDELLVRHDACGICFSDIKIINLGGEHPRLAGRDLQKNPVVMGHEVSLTIVKVGKNRVGHFQVGNRFIVQADIFYKGIGMAYGYALPGGMSEYGVVGKEIVDGDEGNYLLPIADSTGYAEAALVEPWACVEAAYLWNERNEVQPGDLAFDTLPTKQEFETTTANLPVNGTVFLHFDTPMTEAVKVDVGRIHYDGHRYVNRTHHNRNDIKGGGVAWFIGAAGPMGQMHVQRALSLANPPRVLVCTDRNEARIQALRDRYLPLAQSRGITLLNFNVKETGTPDLKSIAPNGFDDIVVMVPDISAVEEAFPHLADNGVLNLFAGIARGTTANLLISDVATKNVRIVGTTGSTIADMRHTLYELEADRLQTGGSLAAIGGLDAFKDGLLAVKEGRFPGKTVIFPHLDLPLITLPDLQKALPTVYEKLRDGQFWTNDAEAELLRVALKHSEVS